MTDWIEHDGGPQPVADDVWVSLHVSDGYTMSWISQGVPWQKQRRYRILNQHLIDAARLEGIRLGLEAAARTVRELPDYNIIDREMGLEDADKAICALEATLDTLTAEAQANDMGYDKHDTKRHPAALIGQEPTND